MSRSTPSPSTTTNSAQYSIDRTDPRDVHQWYVTGKLLHEQSLYKDLPYDELCAKQCIIDSISKPYHLSLTVKCDDRVVGGFIGHIHRYYFNHELRAEEFVWFMHPDHRGVSEGIKLVEIYTAWAEAHGCKYAYLSPMTGADESARIGLLLKRKGFESIGQQYRYTTGE